MAFAGEEIRKLKAERNELVECLKNIGHRSEPEDFNEDRTYGYLYCCEDIIKEARELLKRIEGE